MTPWERVRPWAFEVLFALVAAFAASPVWLVEHPAIQDLPQHLAAVRVLADYSDPALGFAQYFTVDLLRTQYLAYYLLAILLSWPFGVLVANKLLITAAVVGTPYALRALLKALGGDVRLALFAIPLTWNAHLILGFMNFTAAIPLAFWGLALAVRLRAEFTRARAFGLGAVTLVCFYTHVVPFAFLGLGAALVAFEWGDFRATFRRWLPLGPATVAMLAWTQLSPAGESTVSAASGGGSRGQAVFAGAMQNVSELPGWLTDVLHSELDGQLLVAFLLTFLLAAVGGVTRRDTPPSLPDPPSPSIKRRITLLAPLAAALYFVTPTSYDWIWPINARFPLLALLFAIVALPRQRGVLGALTLAAVVGIGVASSAEVGRAFTAFDEQEVGALEEAIESMPRGARVAGLIYDRGSREVKFSPFIHSVAWVQARNGGAVMFTFADFPQSPFAYRDELRPPRVEPRWEWTPERVDPATDLAWYDYVLVRGGPGRIAQAGQPFERIFHDGLWSVWHRER